MERALIGLAVGAAAGAAAGFLMALFESWGKDLRDSRLRSAGIPVPADRVFKHYHWPMAFLGAVNAAGLPMLLPDISPVWAGLSVLAIPAVFLPFLILSALITWLGLFRPARPWVAFDTKLNRRGGEGMSEVALRVAARLAEALDAEDYPAARALLAADCVYHIGDATLDGPDAIIASYRENGEKARDRFDAVEYASRVEPSGSSEAVITYTDRLCLTGEWHEFRCRQHVRVGESGLVEEIRHEELPGERERLREFEARRARPG